MSTYLRCILGQDVRSGCGDPTIFALPGDVHMGGMIGGLNSRGQFTENL